MSDLSVVANSLQAPPAPSQAPAASLRFRASYVPPGFDLKEDKTSAIAVSQAGDKALRQQVLLRKDDGSGRTLGAITIMITTSGGPPPASASEYLAHDPRAEMTKVRGKDAATIGIDGGKAGTMLYWREGQSVSVQIVGRHVPAAEVQNVAEGLVTI